MVTKYRCLHRRICFRNRKLDELSRNAEKWSTEQRKQFSFTNNLLLTLAFGLIAYVFNNKDYCLHPRLGIPLESGAVTLTISKVLIVLSLVVGVLVSISRLNDFRMTAKIALTRKRIFEFTTRSLGYFEQSRFDKCKRLCLFLNPCAKEKNSEKLSITNCKNYLKNTKELDKNFTQLRNMSYNLGLNTWTGLRFQLVFFAFGVICFLFSQL